MKKILIVGNNDVGLHNFRIELIEELIALGNKVYFSVPFGDKVKDIEKTGAVYYPVDLKRHGINPIQELTLIVAYRAMIKRIKPDIILTYTIKPNIYVGILARLRKIPYITTVTGLGTMFQASGLKRKLVEKAYKFATGKAKAVFFQNLTNQQTFIDRGIVKKERAVLVNGSGVNIEKFKPNRQEHEDINFMFIGRIMVDKGINEYLLAAEAIKKDRSDVNFLIVGPYEDKVLRDKIQDLDKKGVIKYLGSSQDTRVEMAGSDCLILPSYHEGMSNVLLEGAASGLPLIASNIPGCRDIIENGFTGFLCKPGNSKALVERITKFLNLEETERNRMGKKGRGKVVREFDRRKTVAKYIDVMFR